MFTRPKAPAALVVLLGAGAIPACLLDASGRGENIAASTTGSTGGTGQGTGGQAGGSTGTGGTVSTGQGAGGSTSSTGGQSGGSTGTGACGNGVIDPGEECDDGNVINDDQCSSGCKVQCTADGSKGLQTTAFVHPTTHHCYLLVFGNNLDWPAAKNDCEQWGGNLASLTPQKEIDDLKSLLKMSSEDCWIGGNDQVKDGTFTWVDGEPWTYVNGQPPWHSGAGPSEPNGGTLENCVEIYDDGTINDEKCDMLENYLCEREPQGKIP